MDVVPVPVTVVTGFLGAGKTTLVNRWLADVDKGDVAVVVNEIGAVGIDGALLEDRVRTLVEISGGCVCCSTQAELAAALEKLATSEEPPKRILIETSGAASPAGVIHVVFGGERSGTVFLDGVITVVDGSRLGTLTEHELAVEQVGYADVVVVSRADACDDVARAHAQDVIASHNGAAFVATSAQGELEDPSLATLEILLDERRADFAPERQKVSPTAEHAYESIALVHDGDLDGDRFADFIESDVARFAGRLLRTKGILAIDGVADRMIVQGVADLADVGFGNPWGRTRRTSRFVIVGFGLDREAITKAFEACIATT